MKGSRLSGGKTEIYFVSDLFDFCPAFSKTTSFKYKNFELVVQNGVAFI